MLVREASFTFEVGESGYLIGFTEHDDYPDEMPYGWHCGPAGKSSAIVLTATDTGPVRIALQVHDSPPAPETDPDWDPAEELSLQTTTSPVQLSTLDAGDILDAWPADQPPLHITAAPDSGAWVRLRLHCHTDNREPGLGDRGERHLLQLWPAPQSPPEHPPLTEAHQRDRADYARHAAMPVEDYTTTYPYEVLGQRG
ncbi:hypothetical protein Scani_00570 [Streptomyces caniferus]|uniref:Uncharacterized protein n=1 Tax=Streptomyces caniferus TaxID=285557 RepID=A0A640RY18_9ACTN|nr:hypothetical protein [Streptomyces caniferus]GFE03789.1 hypothetical protein Scani_00570 [Streptomyces caniferus]